ncbi:MAG TPA: NFACT RNA binding domain-containing protein [Candidatus Baltobacteraceae bacterium]|nr:NFACT RNA binding domain-containing protein [Candidatus Baltobacteraceae bacterium]
MTTDWILIRRAAAELERALTGARLTDAGLLDDGRIGFRLGGGRRAALTLAVDPFGSPPLVTLEEGAPAVGTDPGWLRTVATTLRGQRLSAVRARRGDRVLVLAFGSTSRFGVASESRLVLELVPRYGNVVLVRDRIVVAAAKQFSPADNEARAVQVGLPYEPPPLPAATLDFPAFTRALEPPADGGADAARVAAAALGRVLPELPRLPAASVVAESAAREWRSAAERAAWIEHRGREVLSAAEAAADAEEPLYRYDAAVVHVVPLAQFGSLTPDRPASLLDVFREARSSTTRAKRDDATERRRAALLTRIAKRLAATAGELASVDERIGAAGERDRLRASGDALYTHAHEIPAGATTYVPATNPALTIALDPELDAKANAQAYYARYRKAADALPHLERRREVLAARRETLDVLAFEAERADAATLAELESDLDDLEARRAPRARPAAGKRRALLRIDRPSGARIYVGRSPRENAEITFTVARPGDLWFHARGIPGSHVVLQSPSGRAPDDEDLDAAANLAAANSKAKHAPRVEIDYTERKHVRKQRDAGPGLVWYTNARTRLGRPASP